MRYCKKCGAEIPTGAGFCVKCGSPVGMAAKQGNNRKKWVLAISSGVIILAVAIAGVLYVTGILGGKDEAIQADDDRIVRETPSVSEEAVESTSQSDNSEQKSNAEDMAWEAYVAYKAYIAAGKDAVNYEEDSDEENTETENCDCYALIYLDSDNYPELMVWYARARSGGCLYTYKNGEVIKTEVAGITFFQYREREGYVYHGFKESGIFNECMSCLEGSYCRQLYSSEEGYGDGKGADKIAQELEIGAGEWKTELESGWGGPSNGGYCDTMDEAYTQILSKIKSK